MIAFSYVNIWKTNSFWASVPNTLHRTARQRSSPFACRYSGGPLSTQTGHLGAGTLVGVRPGAKAAQPPFAPRQFSFIYHIGRRDLRATETGEQL